MMRKIGTALFFFYALLIAYMSLAPSSGEPLPINDKVAHMFAYVVFALVAASMGLQRRQYLVICVSVVAYSALLEVGQHFVPGRFMSGLDLLANAVGVCLGIVLTGLLPPQRKAQVSTRD